MLIDEARMLLKEVYCDELGWKPPKRNPIHHRVQDGMLMDDYDDVASWGGIFVGEKLIGVGRFNMCNKPQHELDRYLTVNGDHRLLYLLPERYAEINRMAIRKEYRGTGAHYHLTMFAMEVCYKIQLPMIVTTNSFATKQVYSKIGSRVGSMRYYMDEDPVDVFIIDNPTVGYRMLRRTCQQKHPETLLPSKL